MVSADGLFTPPTVKDSESALRKICVRKVRSKTLSCWVLKISRPNKIKLGIAGAFSFYSFSFNELEMRRLLPSWFSAFSTPSRLLVKRSLLFGIFPLKPRYEPGRFLTLRPLLFLLRRFFFKRAWSPSLPHSLSLILAQKIGLSRCSLNRRSDGNVAIFSP